MDLRFSERRKPCSRPRSPGTGLDESGAHGVPVHVLLSADTHGEGHDYAPPFRVEIRKQTTMLQTGDHVYHLYLPPRGEQKSQAKMHSGVSMSCRWATYPLISRNK